MKIEVLRDACCAADDQAGPLTMSVEFEGRAPLHDLIDSVVKSGFLQYSSTHTSIVGFIAGVAAVRVHSPYHCKEKTQYFIESTMSIQDALRNGSIDFRF